jgi:hypothetical protein
MKRVGNRVRGFVDRVERAGKKPSECVRSSSNAHNREPAIVTAGSGVSSRGRSGRLTRRRIKRSERVSLRLEFVFDHRCLPVSVQSLGNLYQLAQTPYVPTPEEVNIERHRCEMTEAQIRVTRILATRICAAHHSHLCSSMLQFQANGTNAYRMLPLRTRKSTLSEIHFQSSA